MTRVHLSYSASDRGLAETIDRALSRAGFGATNRWEVSSRQDWGLVAEQAFLATDIVVVLVSPAAESSAWAASEAEFTLSRELDRRGIELIPVLAAPTELSPVLRDRAYVDLTTDLDAGLRTLVAQVQAVHRIDFATMGPREFTALVADLLQALGFRLTEGRGDVDLHTTYRRTDPFGLPETQTWLVETKLYSHERFSIEAIRRFAGVLAQGAGDTHGLLVTDVQLTSVAEEYVAELARDPAVRLRILDGVQLRRLLREFPAVAARHFGGDTKVRSDAKS